MLRPLLRSVAIVLGGLLWSAGALPGAEAPQIEFLDRYIPGAAVYKTDPGVLPWTDADKQAFREHWERLQKRVPGLVQRVTAYRPIRLYRLAAVRGGARTLVARPLDHSLSIDDRFMSELREHTGYQPQLLNPIAHECAHLHDAFYRISWSQEWTAQAQPRIDRVRQRFQEQSGIKLSEYLWQKPEQKDPQWGQVLNALAREEGLPRGYGGLNLQESLADSVGYVALGSKIPLPQEIQNFVASRFTSTMWEPDAIGRTAHQGFAAVYAGRAEEAVARLSEVVAQEPGYLMAYGVRGLAYRMQKDYERALADFTRVLEHAPALHDETLKQRALVYLQLRDRARASADCERLLREATEPEVRAWAQETLERLPSR